MRTTLAKDAHHKDVDNDDDDDLHEVTISLKRAKHAPESKFDDEGSDFLGNSSATKQLQPDCLVVIRLDTAGKQGDEAGSDEFPIVMMSAVLIDLNASGELAEPEFQTFIRPTQMLQCLSKSTPDTAMSIERDENLDNSIYDESDEGISSTIPVCVTEECTLFTGLTDAILQEAGSFDEALRLFQSWLIRQELHTFDMNNESFEIVSCHPRSLATNEPLNQEDSQNAEVHRENARQVHRKSFILATDGPISLRLLLHPEATNRKNDLAHLPFLFRYIDVRKIGLTPSNGKSIQCSLHSSVMEEHYDQKSTQELGSTQMNEMPSMSGDNPNGFSEPSKSALTPSPGIEQLQHCRLLAQLIRHLHEQGVQWNVMEVIRSDYKPAIIRKTDPIDDNSVVRARGLPWQATDMDIFHFFSGLTIADGGISLVLSKIGRRNGEALICFTDVEQRDLALRRHKHHMGLRYIELYVAQAGEFMAFAGAETLEAETFLKNFTSSRQALIRLRGLPYSATVEQILEFFQNADCPVQFEEHGVLFVNRPDGRATGDAFVMFDSHVTAEQALQNHRQHIGTRYIELFKSTPAEVNQVMNAIQNPTPSHTTTTNNSSNHSMAGWMDLNANMETTFKTVPSALLDLQSSLLSTSLSFPTALESIPFNWTTTPIDYSNPHLLNLTCQLLSTHSNASGQSHLPPSPETGRMLLPTLATLVPPSLVTDSVPLYHHPHHRMDTIPLSQRLTGQGQTLHPVQPMRTPMITPWASLTGGTGAPVCSVPTSTLLTSTGLPCLTGSTPAAVMDQLARCFVRIRGMPLDVEIMDILNFLEDTWQHVAVHGVHLVYNSMGHPMGEAIVQFISELVAQWVVRYKNGSLFTKRSSQTASPQITCCAVTQCGSSDLHQLLNTLAAVSQQTPPLIADPLWETGSAGMLSNYNTLGGSFWLPSPNPMLPVFAEASAGLPTLFPPNLRPPLPNLSNNNNINMSQEHANPLSAEEMWTSNSSVPIVNLLSMGMPNVTAIHGPLMEQTVPQMLHVQTSHTMGQYPFATTSASLFEPSTIRSTSSSVEFHNRISRMPSNPETDTSCIGLKGTNGVPLIETGVGRQGEALLESKVIKKNGTTDDVEKKSSQRLLCIWGLPKDVTLQEVYALINDCHVDATTACVTQLNNGTTHGSATVLVSCPGEVESAIQASGSQWIRGHCVQMGLEHDKATNQSDC